MASPAADRSIRMYSLATDLARSEQPATPATAVAIRCGGFLLVAIELLLILAVVRLFNIAERNHFFTIACLAISGFFVHAWLAPRMRASFFGLLSLSAIVIVLGWPDGLRVIGFGFLLVAMCHLPVPFALRIAVIALAGFALALMRIELDRPFWALLGSLFMFRLIVYLHELRQSHEPTSLPLTVAFFFPIQNVSFLFFPILDFKTFRETYRASASWADAQEGVVFITRGLVHLVLYRVIKYYVMPSPHQITDVAQLALFLAAGYALYLRVSGHFHIIIGVFHLYGFQLPRTHHNYFLASSFTDIWRRINIYWKDFMAKIFFVPAFFRLRGWGTSIAVVLATLWVFVATWLLHSYQVFWLTGGLPIGARDAVLWLVVGILVAVNLQRDIARAERTRSPERTTWRAACFRVLRIVGMFALISFFWACWSIPSFFVYLRALPVSDEQGLRGVARLVLAVTGVVIAGTVVQYAADRLGRLGILPLRFTRIRSIIAHGALLSSLVLIAELQQNGVFGTSTASVIESLRQESVSPIESAQAVQGYYEEITSARVPASAWLAQLEGRPRPPDQIYYTDMSRPTDDWLERELIPNWSGEIAGAHLTVNRLGMRDRLDRAQTKPPDRSRIAFVGSSIVMGYGVGDNETFTRRLEDRLNARPEGRPPVEFLNFGTGKSYAIHRQVLFDRKVVPFEPDALFYVVHQDELLGPVRHLAMLVARGNEIPYAFLKEIVSKAGIKPDTSWGLTEALLQPFAREIVAGVYRNLAAECRARGILPVWVYVPMPGVMDPPGQSADLAAMAQEAGFVVVSLGDWAKGHRAVEVKLGDADHHANALGHRLIADRLEAELKRRPELLPTPGRTRP